MDDWNSFIESLGEDTAPIPLKRSTEQRYPCGQCAGTGLYSGVRVHQEKKQCFACRGKGYFKTDPRKLEKARQQRAKKKQAAVADAMAHNMDTPIYNAVCSLAAINHQFASSLMEQHQQGKEWSDKQIDAMAAALERMAERRAQREAEAKAVNLQSIIDMFNHAKQSGYARPVYRAEGLKISLAPDSGANAGALYVKDVEGVYLGKVSDAKFYASREATDEHKAALSLIAENPRDAAIRYGRQTGKCSCCGRTLSNKQSIELGIGPVCASRWQLV